MIDWWNSLDGLLRALYCVAIPATLILVIQTVLTMVSGFDDGAGVDVSDTSGLDLPDGGDGGAPDLDLPERGAMDGGNPGDVAAMHLLTLQTVVAFLTAFSWSTIGALTAGANAGVSLVIGLVIGAAAMFVVAKIVQLSSRLAENGTIDLTNAIGETGEVYLPIPAHGAGVGKVTLCVQGSFVECEARTQGEALSTGQSVRVTDVHGGALIVEKEG